MASVILPKQNKTTSVSSVGRGGQVIAPGTRAIPTTIRVPHKAFPKNQPSVQFKLDPAVIVSLALVAITIVISFSLMRFTVGAIDYALTESTEIDEQSLKIALQKFDLISDTLSLDSRISMAATTSKAKVKNVLPVINLNSESSTPAELVEQVYSIIATTNKRQTKAQQLAREIVSESLRQKYDPLFVAAVIKSESAFNEMAVSHVGAQGLMQIMPATGKYLISKHQEHFPKAVKLTDRDVNIKLGIKYLRELEQMYQGNRLLTLIAYNWGPGKLDRAIRSGKGVPKECIKYALKILRDHNIWQA